METIPIILFKKIPFWGYGFSNFLLENLENSVCNNDQERIGQVDQEPSFHWLNPGCAGEGGGDGEVDRGQHHHARDVHRDDQVVLETSQLQHSA